MRQRVVVCPQCSGKVVGERHERIRFVISPYLADGQDALGYLRRDPKEPATVTAHCTVCGWKVTGWAEIGKAVGARTIGT